MPPSSVVVTGSSGTVGTALVERLLDAGIAVTGLDTIPNQWSDRVDDVTVQADLREAAPRPKLPDDPDLVVHFAAHARVHRLVKNPTLARENFDMTFNILEYARDVGADVVFSSSREVYGNNNQLVYDETDTYIDECESPYTASKVGGEALVKSYQNCYDISSCILRFSNVYGRYDGSDRVVPLFIAQAHDDQDLTVYGDNKVLDFTYLDDCVDGVMRVITSFNKAKGTTFNIASGEGTSLLELAQAVTEQVPCDSTVHVEPDRTGEIARYVADISKAQKVLGYEPEHSLQSGLERTIEWYRERPALIDDIA
jgi:UDP-glucose 4-epimerase